jgi:CubicO group peptidase (beta-lactamase class C family)
MSSGGRAPLDRRRAARFASTSLVIGLVAVVTAATLAVNASTESGAELESRVDRLLRTSGVRAVVVAGPADVEIERYASPSASGHHNIKSASKSIVSLLVGIAIDHGELPGLDVQVADLLPASRDLLDRDPLERLTMKHLLTMTAGLESTSGEAYGAWVAHDDWVRAALERPVVAELGERFVYSTGSSHVAAAALAAALEEDLPTWARTVLFDPLGIGNVRWSRSPTGRVFGGNNLAMRPVDLARIGSMVLQRGRWNDRRIVSADWIERSGRRHAEGWPDRYGAYGIGWWIPEPGTMLAVGYGGQFLLVDAALDSTVVVISTGDGKGAAWDREVIDRMESVLEARADRR